MKFFALITPALCVFSTSAFAGAPNIKKICTGVDATTDIREKYLEHLLSENPMPLNFIYSAGPDTNALFKKCLDEENSPIFSKNKNCAQVKKIQLRIKLLLDVGETGPRNALKLKTTGLVPTGEYQREVTFMDLHNKTYALNCKKVFKKQSDLVPPEPGLNLNWKNVTITKDTTTIHKKTAKKQSAAISIDLDRGKKIPVTLDDGTETFRKNDVVSANVTLALKDFIVFTPPKDMKIKALYSPSFTPFLSLEYKSNLDPNEETDNLAAGLIWNQYFRDINKKNYLDEPQKPYSRGRFELNRFSLEAKYITDIEQRESQQWLSQITLPFFSFDASSYKDEGSYFSGYFQANLVGDYSEIARAGDKVKLGDLKSFSRLGYDIIFNTSIQQNDGWHIGLDAKYQFRDARNERLIDPTDDPISADANWWDISLAYKPKPDSNFSYGVTYKRGEVISSLESKESWNFGLMYKQ